MSSSPKKTLRLVMPLALLSALSALLFGCTISNYEQYASAGVAQYEKKDYAKAEESFVLALKDAERTGPDELINKSLVNLANVEEKLGKTAEATEHAERAVQIATKIFPKDDRAVLEQSQFLANLYMKEARFAEAQKLLERVLAEGDKGLTATGKAQVRGNLALILRAHGRLAEAEAANMEVLKVYEKELKSDDYHIGVALINLGSNNMDGGKLDEARTNTERGLTILRKSFGKDDAQLATAEAQLAMILWRQGKKTEAEAIYKEALPALEAVNKQYASTKLSVRYPPSIEACSKLFADRYAHDIKSKSVQGVESKSAQ